MSTYRVAGIHVVHQNIVGEVIVVDLQSGTYFSLTESAPVIWDLLIAGHTRESIAKMLEQAFIGDLQVMQSAVNELVDFMLSEKLIAECEAGSVQDVSLPASREPFAKPVFQKYTDMEDVLVLDPIHDFDDAGWPNVPVATTV